MASKDVKKITVMLRDIEKLTTATKAEETKDKGDYSVA